MVGKRKIEIFFLGRAGKSKKFIFLIPHILSFSSALLGFFSLLQNIQGNYISAAYAIFYATLLDACDGRIARFIGSESSFGEHLDALADSISFCLAPAVLIYSIVSQKRFLFTFFFPLSFFVCAGIFRLARFQAADKNQEFFLGLPTTGAAFFLVNLVVWLNQRGASLIFSQVLLISICIVLSFLMISSCCFPTLKTGRLSPFGEYVKSLGIFFLVLCLLEWHGVLLSLFSFYIISSILSHASGNYTKRLRDLKFYR